MPDSLSSFVGKLSDCGYCGANVTLPYKEQALTLCDWTSDLARRLGAVNTLWFEDGRLHGDNTDVDGFLANLDEQARGWDLNCKRAIVLGAGGAARAVLAGLAAREIESVTLLNRSLDRARQLADEASGWGFRQVRADSLDPAGLGLSEADLLINTTSLGMEGQPRLDLDLSRFPEDAVVCDIVYTPLETELLKNARMRRLRTSSGLGMLLHQAVPGFEHWFGLKPEVTKELRTMIEADIKRDKK